MRSRLGNSLRNALTAAFLFSCFAPCALADEKEAQLPYVISLDESSKRVTKAKEELLAALKSVVPSTKRGEIMEKAGSPYVLYGDLFGNRKSYAVVELNGSVGLGLAAWDGKEWQPRGLWDISPVWRPKGWESKDDDYLPYRPADKPFWVKELSGDRVNEIVVAGLVDRYFQEFHLFRFDSASEQLQWVDQSMDEPKFTRGYLRLYHHSGRRAEWGEYLFRRWVKGRLVSVADWREEVPYSNPDAYFWDVVTYNSRGNKEAAFRITPGESEIENESIYIVTRNGDPFSKVVIRWKTSHKVNPDRGEADLAFLFERLTWIPRSLYPGADKDLAATVTLEKQAEIIVTGKPLKR